MEDDPIAPDAPIETPDAPDAPIPSVYKPMKQHVNGKNHQLYNVPIYTPMKGVGQQRRLRVEEISGGPKNPLTIMKPLKPNAMDDYDKAVKSRKKKARGGQKFVEVRS